MSFFKRIFTTRKLSPYQKAAINITRILEDTNLLEPEWLALLAGITRIVGSSFKDTTLTDPLQIVEKARKGYVPPGEALIVLSDEILALIELHYAKEETVQSEKTSQ